MPSEEHSGSSVLFTHVLNMKSYGKSQLSLSPRSIQLRTGNKTHKSQHVQVALDAKSTGCATPGVTAASGRLVLWSLTRRWFCHRGDTWPCLETWLCYNLGVDGCSGRWRTGMPLSTYSAQDGLPPSTRNGPAPRRWQQCWGGKAPP